MKTSCCSARLLRPGAIGYSFSTGCGSFYALAVINGLMINGITMMSIGVLVNNWFIPKKGHRHRHLLLGLRDDGGDHVRSLGSVIEIRLAVGVPDVGTAGILLLVTDDSVCGEDHPPNGFMPSGFVRKANLQTRSRFGA
jgi:hypothetical protein